MHQVPTFDGITLTVHDHGGTGRPTLLCHATGFHGAVWEPLSGALGAGLRCWAMDFRAHGASVTPPDHPLEWMRLGEDVLAVVDDLDEPAGTLLGVGHSMGGAALLLAEQARPGTFSRLWAYEPIVPPPARPGGQHGGSHLAEGARKRRPSFPSAAEALANFASKPPLDALRADVLHAYVRHGFVFGDDGTAHLACRPEDEARFYAGGGEHGGFERLGQVACPVAVVCGGDPVGPSRFAPAIAEALPSGRLERHEHLGHFGPLEAPGEMAASVRAFAGV